MKSHNRLLSALLASMVIPSTHGQTVTMERLISSGDSLLTVGRPHRAVELMDKALESGPDARALLIRSKAYEQLERMDRSLLDVEWSLRIDSTLAEAHYQRGMHAMRGNEYQSAETSCTKAIAYSENDLLRDKAYTLRGTARAELKRYEPAIEDLERGASGSYAEPDALRTLARLLDLTGRHEGSLKVLERLCEMEPADVGHWTNRGFELIMLGRYEEAFSAVETALSLDKDEPIALSNRAYIQLKMGRGAKPAFLSVKPLRTAHPCIVALEEGRTEKGMRGSFTGQGIG